MTEETQSRLKRPADGELNLQQYKTVKMDEAVGTFSSENEPATDEEKSLANRSTEKVHNSDVNTTDGDISKPVKATIGDLHFSKESKEQSDEITESPIQSEPSSHKPKFGSTSVPVFGATTVFAKKPEVKKDVFADLLSNNTSTLSFGSGSRFGSALQNAVKKQSFLDTAPVENPLIQDLAAKTPEQFKQVDLTPAANITTGEEDEDSISSAQAKLFVLDLTKVADGWKERGKGLLHLNQKRSNKREARLVMRGQGLLRVVLNYRITGTTKLINGFDASLTPGKFVRFNSLSEDKKPIQYLIKFGSEATCDAMLLKITEIINELLGKNSAEKDTQDTKESDTLSGSTSTPSSPANKVLSDDFTTTK